MTTRGEFITGLRDLADFLTVNPDVPVPAYRCQIQVSASGHCDTDDEKRSFVDRAALAMGAEPHDPYGDGEHWEAGLHFGPLYYFAIAITKAQMEDFREETRLGREALAARKSIEAEAAEVYDADRLHSGEKVTIHTADRFDGLDGEIVQPDEEGGFEVALPAWNGAIRHFEASELTRRPVLAGGAS
jgi:hypothetical protein